MSERLMVKEETDSFNPEALGKKLFELRDYTPIPLIVLLLIAAKPNAASATVGTLLVVFGELLRIYAVAFIGSISRTRSDNTGHNLIRTGPFGYVRIPLYVGNFFITFGLAVFGGAIWFMVVAAALFGFQYFYIVKYEEALLAKKFGADYDLYRKEVPAWIPKRRIKLDDIECPSTFAVALRSEKRTLTAIAAMLIVLVFVSMI